MVTDVIGCNATFGIQHSVQARFHLPAAASLDNFQGMEQYKHHYGAHCSMATLHNASADQCQSLL